MSIFKTKFKPKEEHFFNLFDKQASLAQEAANVFKDSLDDFPDLKKTELLKEIGDKGDKLREEMDNALENSFITPFDPEDIHVLTIYLDKILGRIYSAAMRMKLYKVNLTDKFKEYTTHLAEIMVSVTECLIEGLNLLRSMDTASAFVHKVKKLEQEGDTIQREATAALFDGSVSAIEIIKWKEIYEQIEAAIDLCEDISHHIDNVIIKHS
jgi:uncharacterized protein